MAEPNSKKELGGMKAAAYVADELDKGKTMEELAKEFDGDFRTVRNRVAFSNYHNWIARDAYGKWYLSSKGKYWVRRLLAILLNPLAVLLSIEEIIILDVGFLPML